MKTRPMSDGLRICLEKAQYDPVAAYDAALLLEAGYRGQSAIQYFYLRAAEGGYTPAMLKVAGLFITGRYLEVSGDESVGKYMCSVNQGFAWIRRAADAGDASAKYALARCYSEGLGVTKNAAKADFYLSSIPFPYQTNPYTPTEALVFGNISPAFQNCILRRLRRAELATAG